MVLQNFGVRYGLYENSECWIRGGVVGSLPELYTDSFCFFSTHLLLRQPNILREVRVTLGLGER